ncbi:hypothetical protein [Paraherbaspirillum soli]|uniref:DUF1983 domain-containing protein n=1 Tax=Paraherbaspirillum soli TaxID=631222 RepID=A0ABW0MD84_9BURK
MSSSLIQRPHYFAGEALLTADFICEQQYHMEMQSYNNQSLYTYGIASGLEIFWDAESNSNQVEVSPGMAIDCLGRQIILLQPQVVKLVDVMSGSNYFLTISYDNVYADLNDETGVAGYKRIVEQPRIQYVRNLQQPGLNVLLAVIGFATKDTINQLTYRSGNIERRYVGSSLGALNFITEGTGVHKTDMPNSLNGFFDAKDNNDLYPCIRAKRETSGQQAYLEVDAARSQFMGLVTTGNNLGIGSDQPLANLQVEAITFKGQGVLTSTGELVTLSKPPTPFFQVGDVLISDPPATVNNGRASFWLDQRRTITAVNQELLQVTVESAFDPPLDHITYTYIRGTLARFGSGNSFLNINIDGTVELGGQASASTGRGASGHHALFIAADRKVGINLSDRDPEATLDVNGKIQADELEVNELLCINTDGTVELGKQASAGTGHHALFITADRKVGIALADRTPEATLDVNGAVHAKSFVGDGSELTNLPAMANYWTLETDGRTSTGNLYYTDGNVGIRNNKPLAALSVGGGQSFIGKGLVTSISDGVLQGYQTAFLDQVAAGDTITIGMLVEQVGVISKIISGTELILKEPLPIALSNSAYSYQAPGGDKQAGTGKISSDGSTVTGIDTNFGDEDKFVVGGKIIIDRFDVKVIPPSDTTQPQTMYVQAVKSQTELSLILPNGKKVGSATFSAATSAYVVTPSLLAHISANGGDTVLPPAQAQDIPPALVITTNHVVATPNTVAINLPLDQIQSRYALQVNGDVSFGSGALHAGGNIVSDATLESKAMQVAGTTINADGSVQIIGNRVAYDQKALIKGGTSFEQVATSDGYVMAAIGQPIWKANHCGSLAGTTSHNGKQTSIVHATALAYQIKTSNGNEDDKTISIPVPGSFTMPVKQGETWTLKLTWNADIGKAPPLKFYWIPLGPPPPNAKLAEAEAAAILAGDDLRQNEAGDEG